MFRPNTWPLKRHNGIARVDTYWCSYVGKVEILIYTEEPKHQQRLHRTTITKITFRKIPKRNQQTKKAFRKNRCHKVSWPTNLSGRVGSVSTALHTGSQVFINSPKPKEAFRSKIRGANPRQLVCKQVILAVSMSESPAEIMAKSTSTLSS